jgi:tetratricopeptide (TPR) repeat protein
MDIDRILQLASQYHQEGNLQQAEITYKEILKFDPYNIHILNYLGNVLQDQCKYDEAIDCYQKAIQCNPTFAGSYYHLGSVFEVKGQNEKAINYYLKAIQYDPHFVGSYSNLGNVFRKLDRIDEAIPYFQKAIEVNAHFWGSYYNLGKALQKKGEIDEAIFYFQKTLQLNQTHILSYNNLGNSFKDKGKFDEAITCYQKVITLNPSFAEAYSNLGNVLREKGQLDEAIINYEKAIELDPSFAEAYSNLGNVLREKGRIDEAIRYCQKAIELNPSLAKAYCNMGVAIEEKGQLDEAIINYEKAIELDLSLAEAYSNLGNVLQAKGQLDEAIINYEKAIELDPSFAEAYSNLGAALQEKGQLDEAIINYEKAIELDPHSACANFNMALILLLSGNFNEGWEKYEWRWKVNDFLKNSLIHHPNGFPQPVWDGSSLKGEKLLIYSEQGIGDEIMFASCFQDVVDRAPMSIMECDKRLKPILTRSFPNAVFIERVKETVSYSSQLPQTDPVIALGSLPKILRTECNAFPRKSYLIPDTDKVQSWHNRLRIMGEGLKVGISWRGGRVPRIINKRSIMLDQWAKILSLSGLYFINLQYGECENELREVKKKIGVTIHDWEDVDPLKDLDNFAAQIAALDLIISVDNSTVHMAGALGKPVWVLLPYVPDWRWMLNREDSPWYPSIRLFRQPSLGDWESVITKVKDELLKLLVNN